MNYLINLDEKITLALSSIANKPLDWLAIVISSVGELAIVWFLLAIILIFANKKESRLAGILIIVAILISVVIDDYVIKLFVFRQRPYLALEGVHQIGHKWENSSFPSGHVTSAIAAGWVLAYYYRKWLWPVVGFVFLTMFSRVYFGMHYFTDVLAGVPVGIVSGYIAILLGKKFSKK